jgi:hypothetical protein
MLCQVGSEVSTEKKSYLLGKKGRNKLKQDTVEVHGLRVRW